MPIPSITIHISGNMLAVYGAILSTITGAIHKDRAHLKIRVQHNMEIDRVRTCAWRRSPRGPVDRFPQTVDSVEKLRNRRTGR
jgi:hypothetical protein